MAHTNKVCGWCGEPYLAQRSTSRFCSSSCRSHAHRYKQDPDKEVDQVKTSIFEFYKQQIAKLTPEQIFSAVATLSKETKEERNNRTQSLLFTMLNKESQNV